MGLQSKMEEFFGALEKQMVPFGYVATVKAASPVAQQDEFEPRDAPEKDSNKSAPLPKVSPRIQTTNRSGTVVNPSVIQQPGRQSSSTLSVAAPRPTIIQKQKSANDLGSPKNPPEIAKKKSFGSIVRRDPK